MSNYRFTNAQREVMRLIAQGYIIRRDGRGFSLRSPEGGYIGKASIAVKTLALDGLLAKAGDRIYFTTSGFWKWFGGPPLTPEADERVKLADETLAYVKSMLISPE